MTDTLPLWLWLPIAAAAWGYLIADTLVRRARRRQR